MSGRDRLDLIELLARIAETGSLSAAAKGLGLSQPSASRLLRRLETTLNAALVQRSTHALALTPTGERFLHAGRALLADWNRAVEEVRAERDEMEGPLRIVAPVAAAQSVLATIAARFVRDHPGVTIDWRLRDDATDPTPDGFDLWIRAGEVTTEDLVVRDLWHIERAVVAAPAHPMCEHPAGLVGERAVRLVTFVPELVELTHRAGECFALRQKAAFLTDNLFAARAAVLEGAGYAILPLWAVRSDLGRGVLVRLCIDWSPPVVTLSLAYPPGRFRPRRLVELLAYIKSELTQAGGPGFAFLDEIDAHDTISSAPGFTRG